MATDNINKRPSRAAATAAKAALSELSSSYEELDAPMAKKQKIRDVEEEEFAEDKEEQLELGEQPITKIPRAKKTVKKSTPIHATPVKPTSYSKAKVSYYQNVQEGKPEPLGQPEAWSIRRQPLCETTVWFNSHQGGVSRTGGIAYGLLIDKMISQRDKFGTEVIITRCGGGMVATKDGGMVQAEDQITPTNYAICLMNSMELNHPIGVIAGQGNPLSPSALPFIYNYLGWFHITLVWPERQRGMTLWMVRLEKIDLATTSWWAPKQQLACSQTSPASQATTRTMVCTECNESSKTIFNADWACLKPECSAYFEFSEEFDAQTLDYNETFLNERTSYTGEDPGPLAPPLLTAESIASMGAYGFEAECKKGIVCPKCRCCTSRVHWTGWECENCKFLYSIPQDPLPIEDVLGRFRNHHPGPLPADTWDYGVRQTILSVGSYTHNVYQMPGEDGEPIGLISVLKASDAINMQKDGPNELFLELQKAELGLKRNAAKKGTVSQVLTSHWASNWGAPYKYHVAQGSKSFSDAPEAILKGIKRLIWAGKYVTTGNPEPFQPFDELLSVGYFETTVMHYHDDGEEQLGPTVASLSLGCPATMSFRAKIANTIGFKKGRKTKSPSLKIQLEHGDIMVMHGAAIQKLYEHEVVPHGELRFAMTSRKILPEKLKTDEERAYASSAGDIPASFAYDYDGSIPA